MGYTLQIAITGGADWADIAQPLMSISPLLVFCFTLYVAFAVLCVLNIATGVFVQKAFKTKMHDDDAMLVEDQMKRREWLEEVQFLFERADLTRSGGLDL